MTSQLLRRRPLDLLQGDGLGRLDMLKSLEVIPCRIGRRERPTMQTQRVLGRLVTEMVSGLHDAIMISSNASGNKLESDINIWGSWGGDSWGKKDYGETPDHI